MSNEELQKRLAYVTAMLLKTVTGQELDLNEIQSLDNIAGELGFQNLDEKEFRW